MLPIAVFPMSKSSTFRVAERLLFVSNIIKFRIMRIVHMLPAFSWTSWVAIALPNSYVYLQGWTEVFQAIALYSFHMLLIAFLGPTERQRDAFFSQLKIKKSFRRGQYRDGLSWLKVSSKCFSNIPKVLVIRVLTDVFYSAQLLFHPTVPFCCLVGCRRPVYRTSF